MAKWNKWVQIMAVLALFWIIIWIVWTWLIIMFGNSWTQTERTLTPEEYLELQELMNANSGAVVETNTWTTDIIDVVTNSWSEEK